MTTSILITGGSGLIGTRLTELLIQKGCRVSHLGRAGESGPVPSFVWDVHAMKMDVAALDGVDAIVHLAGAGIANKRWTGARKKEILDSRVNSTALLSETMRVQPHKVKTFISASAIGYYGSFADDHIVTEESPPGNDFLAKVVVAWESAADTIATQGIRVVKIRTGIVMSGKGGALREIARPVRWGVGAPLGSGKQYMSWIHEDDLCNFYIKAMEDTAMNGAYNAVAPHGVTNLELTKVIASILQRPLWLPGVPLFALRILVGEIADTLVRGSNVSNARLVKSGFRLQFPELRKALEDALGS